MQDKIELGIQKLLKSRRFTSAALGLIVAVIVALVPSLQDSEAELTNLLQFLGVALIAGYSLEDVAKQVLPLLLKGKE